MSGTNSKMKILMYGWNGWIGSQVLKLLEDAGHEVIKGTARLENYDKIIKEVEWAHNKEDVTHVINCAGLTGRPNVDWCEDHKIEVTQVNVIGSAVLSDMCHRLGLHYTYMGTGCIFQYDEKHQEPSIEAYPGFTPFTEDDKPNFDGSFYSFGKIMTENITKQFPNSLILRIRMPISDDLHPRSFVTKITKYEKVVNIQNSMSVLTELLPVIPDMMLKKKTGIYNFTNPGTISHNEILKLYKTIIDLDFTWKNFSLDQQDKILKAPRSNNYLDSSKLKSEYPEINDIHTAMTRMFTRMHTNNSISNLVTNNGKIKD